MPFTLPTVLSLVKNRIRIEDGRFPEEEKFNAIRDALSHFSTDRPLIFADDVSGTDPFVFPTNFIVGFSRIKNLEDPIGSSPPVFLREHEDYEVIHTGSGTRLHFISLSPSLPFRLIYTGKHTLEGLDDPPGDTVASSTTIPDGLMRPFGLLVCHYSALSVATVFAGTQTNVIVADSVNYRSKEAEWRNIAKEFLGRYNDVVKEGDEAAVDFWDVDIPDLLRTVPRIWHTRRKQ